MLLTKSQILAADDLKTTDVDVPEWGGTVRIKGMTGAERDAFEETLFTGEGTNRKTNLTNMRARLVAVTIIGEDGNRLFSDAEVGDLAKKSAAALSRCFEAAQRLNGMTGVAVDEAKNASSVAPNDASTSA